MSKTIDLRKTDLRKVPVGTVVVTSKGFKFKLISRKSGREGWRDLSSKLVWFSKEDGSYNFDEAISKFGDKLPTKEEFEEAENHGFREVLEYPHDYFWSASVYSNNRNYAWIFGGGLVAVTSRSSPFAVRCVGR